MPRKKYIQVEKKEVKSMINNFNNENVSNNLEISEYFEICANTSYGCDQLTNSQTLTEFYFQKTQINNSNFDSIMQS